MSSSVPAPFFKTESAQAPRPANDFFSQDARAALGAHLPALDGLRALAILFVLVFHLAQRALPGGFIGVEIFFVLSGFLITRRLLHEHGARGRISLARFYWRRAKRLYPALLIMLAGALALVVIRFPADLMNFFDDLVASLFYYMNWHLVASRLPYFEQSAYTPMLRHLWSLSVEEQFYLLWPLLLVALLALRRAPRALAALALLAAGGFAAQYALRGSDPRNYYGTDSRCGGFLLGGFAAFAVAATGARAARARRALATGAAFALPLLGALAWRMSEFSPGLYRGGLAAVAALTALLCAAIAAPGFEESALSRALSWAPLTAIGRRSYEIYLWHWPLWLVLRPAPGAPAEPATLIAAGGLSLIAGWITHALVEGLAAPARPRPAGEFEALQPRMSFFAFASSVVFILIAGAVIVPARAGNFLHRAPPPVAPAPVAPAAPRPPARKSAPPPPVCTGPGVLMIGDSVMLGAARELKRAPGCVKLDAKIGRQTAPGLAAAETRLAAGSYAAVVIHLGNNGPLDEAALRRFIAGHPGLRVVLVNDRVPREWEPDNNAALARIAADTPSVALLDWNGAGDGQEGWFEPDGIHLRPAGAVGYRSLIVGALSAPAPADDGTPDENPPTLHEPARAP